MTAIPFPISSAPGVKPQEGSGRLINCFAEKNEQGARFPVKWRRCAGLRELMDADTDIHLRGAVAVGGTLITVFNDVAYAVDNSFTATSLGFVNGSGRVTIAVNNADTPNIVSVSTEGVMNLFTDATPTDFADADLPPPLSVSALDGYFLFVHGDGRITASELNSVDVATNSFTTMQQRPGGGLRGVAFRGEFFAFGPSGCEVYRDKGASPFPLEFFTFIPRGIIGTHAVAGWEEGWSNDLIWVGDDCVVYQLNGYNPTPISNDDVTRAIINAVAGGFGALLEASVYMQGKHAIWRLSLPGVWTWEYNKTTQNWHERRSYNGTAARGSTTIKAFDRWLSGDRLTGKLFEIVEDYYYEGDEPLRYILRSGAAAISPSRMAVVRMDFDFTAGVGSASGTDPIETDPSVLVRWSGDGGFSFGNAVTRKLGQQGKGNNRVTVLRGPATGPKGLVVEVEVDDPVHVGFLGGDMVVETRAS